MSRQRVPAPALVLLAIASVQTGAAIARTLFDELGVAGTALLRLVIAAVVLLLVLRPPVLSWTRRQWAAAGLLGFALAGMNLVFYYSLDLIPLGVAVTVEFTGPLLLALVQTRRLVDFLWALLAGAGVALLGLRAAGGAVEALGLVLAFTAGLFWAGYIVSSARVGRTLPGVDGLAVALAVAAVLVLPLGFSEATAVVDDPALLGGVAAVALMSSIIPYGLELVALRRIPTRVFGVLMSLQPAAAAISGWIILDQRLGPVELTALAMVSLASLGITLASRTEERAEDRGVGPIG
ncbi:MAG TPA: EamA family transporter [Actinomycetes bacterium]|nr:EamA family transporter [Actinomycetes bacterium]